MKERKVLVGRINTDADQSVFPENEMLDCENVSHIIAADGRIAAMKPVNGTRKIDYTGSTLYPFPKNAKTVGSFSEDDKGRMYYFIHDPLGINHQILCYFRYEDKTYLVFHSKHLAFTGSPITGIDKIGDIIYWVEDEQQPRKVNVERGLQTYAGLQLNQVSYIGNGVAPTLKDITLIRPNPQYPPTFQKVATNQVYNFISDYSFQFAFRYVYRDKEISVLSPYSFIANYNSKDENDKKLDAIRVRLPLQTVIPWEVEKIQLVVRERNIGTFFIIKQWDRYADSDAMANHNNGSPLEYMFYNDQNGVAISEEESAKPFDNVPIYSRALAGARNRLFLGNNTFGYDKVKNGSIVATITNEGSPTDGQRLFGRWVVAELTETLPDQAPVYTSRLYLVIDGASSDVNGYYNMDSSGIDPYEFGRPLVDADGGLPILVTVESSMRIDSVEWGNEDSYIQANIQEKGFYYNYPPDVLQDLQVTVKIYREYSNPLVAPHSDYDVEVVGLPGFNSSFGSSYGFKSASKYRVGVVFYDFAGRNAGVYSTSECVVRTSNRTYLDAVVYPYIKVSLDFAPEDIPEWAETYQIVRTRNLSYQSFVQGFTRDVQYVGKDKDGNYQFGDTAATVFTDEFDSNKVQGIAINLSAISSFGLGYQYSEGDYIKIWNADGTIDQINIISQVGSYAIIQSKDLGTLSLNGSDLLFELVSPRKTFLEETFYEVGRSFQINAPGTSTRSLSTPIVTLSGDTYIVVRAFTGGSALRVETMNPSDAHWSEWLSDIGRPNVIPYGRGRSIRNTSICYSNAYVQSTEVNGLSSFDALDFRDLDFTVGAIRKLILTNRTQEYGSVMLAICETETASIYLGENRIVDNADVAILATSGDVIGTINPLKGSYGTVHPESVYESEGRVYFVDAVNGKVIMYSQNGLEPISQNGMTKFFASALFEIGSNQRGIYGTIDKRSEIYMVYMPQGGYTYPLLMDYDPPKPSPHHVKPWSVFCYNPELQGWATRMTFNPEWMDSTAESIVSWVNGELYVHDGVPSNNFYGTVYPSTVSFVIGSPEAFVKTAEAIAIEADRAPSWVHLRNEVPFLQSTDLEQSEFVSKEGIHYASFLRDRLTPGKGSYENALILGEPIRGQFIACAVRYNGGSLFHVTGITVSFDKSVGHPMLQQQR